jgi:hypothetical protein
MRVAAGVKPTRPKVLESNAANISRTHVGGLSAILRGSMRELAIKCRIV